MWSGSPAGGSGSENFREICSWIIRFTSHLEVEQAANGLLGPREYRYFQSTRPARETYQARPAGRGDVCDAPRGLTDSGQKT